AYSDLIDGDNGANILAGDLGDDHLLGEGGSDTLDGGVGSDTMVGGLGDDTYAVDNVGDVTTENFGEGADTVLSSVTWTLGAALENLTLTGDSAINGAGNGLN